MGKEYKRILNIILILLVLCMTAFPKTVLADINSNQDNQLKECYEEAYYKATLMGVPNRIESDIEAYAYLINNTNAVCFNNDGTIAINSIDLSMKLKDKSVLEDFVIRLNNLVKLDAISIASDLKILCVTDPQMSSSHTKVRSASILTEAKHHAKQLKSVYDNAIFSQKMATAGLYFAERVRTGGIWDYKSYMGAKTIYYMEDLHTTMTGEDIGNFHYGYVGRAVFPPLVLKSAAGMYQVISGTSTMDYFGTFFDDPADQAAIEKGISKYEDDNR